jgi:hypothetical protein
VIRCSMVQTSQKPIGGGNRLCPVRQVIDAAGVEQVNPAGCAPYQTCTPLTWPSPTREQVAGELGGHGGGVVDGDKPAVGAE